MPTVTNTIIITPDSNRTSGNVFSQKQTWYKEMEKARQLLIDKNQSDTNTEFSNLNEYGELPRAEDVPVYAQASDTPANAIDLLSKAQAPYAAPFDMVAGLVSARTMPAGQLISNENTGVMFQLISTSKVGTQPAITQQTLSSVERILRSEIQPQSLQFINAPDGIKVYFRDYRLDDNETRKIMEKIRQLLAKLNIGITDIVVNGNIIEQKRAVNQEAT